MGNIRIKWLTVACFELQFGDTTIVTDVKRMQQGFLCRVPEGTFVIPENGRWLEL